MIKLRAASIQDLQLLLHWDTQTHVVESDPEDDWNWALELKRNPPWREQLIAEWHHEPVGFIQIIDPQLEETQYWGEIGEGYRAIDIWIGEAKNLGKGIGTMMMHQAIERCFANPEVDRILIDPLKSNVKAHRFYKKLGFEFVEERIFNGIDCLVFELKRSPGEL